ncbi:hypothetical protein RHMOL_Rhmol01G0234400 [Rhododendron molle]|uniref:Uncharacterized protein n=1 Tax=Rhododendron molle TaxID=49168 RepID=A0ACC0Q568_RHOML|nr:hypothetical protein RHMOL_Rhmol01G0234400 [Rhododendron molle]
MLTSPVLMTFSTLTFHLHSKRKARTMRTTRNNLSWSRILGPKGVSLFSLTLERLVCLLQT